MNIQMPLEPQRPVEFTGSSNNRLAGDHYCELQNDPHKTVVLLHGGGQTRHSWRGTAQALTASGWNAVIVDQRGHGESDWVQCGSYEVDDFAGDLTAVCDQIKAQTGYAPVVVGASLGGVAGMVAFGEASKPNGAALVLVDITPHMKIEGVERVLGFMAERAETGFQTLEEAADAIAAYLPHRPRPRDLSGLAKNLRLWDDGRYRWHWDPRFLSARKEPEKHRHELAERLTAAVQNIDLPVLLVRGRESELVGEGEAQAFKQLVPHAHLRDVSGARHMIAGDRNDVFSQAVLEFLEAL